MKQLLTILFVLSAVFVKGQAYIGSDGTIHPTGAFPVINSNEAKGTIKRAKSLSDRDALPVSLRDTGMLCWVSDSAKFYVLAGGVENFRWVDLITTGVVGGVAFERDPIFTNSPSYTITEQKKAYWDLVGLMLRADSVRSEIHDSIMVHQRPPINYDQNDFTVTNDTLHAIGKVNGETDPIYNNSVWGQLPDTKPEEWDAKVEQGALNDTAAAIRRSFKADTIYHDARDFYNTGGKNDPLRIKRYTNAQIDSLILANGGKIGDSSGVQFNLAGYYTKIQVDSIVAAFGGTLQDGLVKPGYVTWSGTGYTYDVTGAVYVINGKPYKSSPGSITLDASDGALNRIDAIVLDTLGAIQRITGVAASNPVAPIPDPSSQVLLTNITVNAGSTGPNSLNTVVWNEKGFGEYLTSANSTTVNPDNTNFPYSGAKSLDVGAWTNGSTVTFTNATTASATSYTYFKFFIRLKSIVTDFSSIGITFYNGNTPVSKTVSVVSYGINKKLVGVYQNISVPISVFGFTANQFNKIQVRLGGANTDGLYIDYVQLQNSTVTETGSNALTDVYVQGDSLFKTVGGNSFFVTKINTTSGTTIDTSFLRRDINLNTQSIATKEPIITAGTTSQFWRGDKTWQTVQIVDTQFLRRDINTNTANITTNTSNIAANTAAIANKLNLNFGTQGSILFRGVTGITQDNSKLFYDSLNNRVGIGTNVPLTKLHVYTTDRNGGIYVEGNNAPHIGFVNSGVGKGGLGLVSAPDDYFLNSIAGDITLRAGKSKRVLIGVYDTLPNGQSNVPALIADGSNVLTLPKYKNNSTEDSILTTDVNGKVKLKYITGGTGGSSYTLPTASSTTLGGVKVGANLSIDGNGVLSASAVGGTSASLTAISDLKAYDASVTPNGTYTIVSGYYAANDGGGGTFIWNSTSTATDNGGTIIKPTALTTGRWIRVYNGDLNVKWFGAIPNGSRIVTTSIQAALNIGGKVLIPYDANNYIIDDRLIIKSNTWLDVDPNATIFEASGNNTVLIRNQNIDSSATGTTDHDIRITGGIWDANWVGNPGTNDFGPYLGLRSDKTNPTRGARGNIGMFGVSNFKILNATIINPVTNGIQLTKGKNFEIAGIKFVRNQSTVSDGVHVGGNSSNFYVHNITGSTGDDFIGLLGFDWVVTAPGSAASNGGISKFVIENLRPDTSVWATVKIYPSDVGKITDGVIRDVKGISQNAGVAIVSASLEPDQYNPTHTTGMGSIANLLFENISIGVLASTSGFGGAVTYGQPFLIAANASNVTIKDAIIDSTYKPHTTQPFLRQQAGTSIDNLDLQGIVQVDSLTNNNMFLMNGSFKYLKLSNSKFYGSGSLVGNRGAATIQTRGTTAGFVTINKCSFNGISAIIDNGVANASISVTDNYVDGINDGIYTTATSARVSLSNNHFKNITTAITQIGGGAVTVYSSNNNSDGTGAGLLKSAGTVRWNGTDIKVDVANLTPSAYDIANNSNSASATIGNNQYSGSAWVAWGSSGGTGTPGGATTQIQYNNAGAFAGSANLVFDGTQLSMPTHTTTKNTSQFGTFGIQSYSLNNGWLSDNEYFDGTNFRYRSTGFGVLNYFAGGDYIIQAAPSGTAGATATNTTIARFFGGNKTVSIGTQTANSTLHVGGSFATAYVAKTAAYTATINDYTIDCNGTFTVTIPTAIGITGRIYVIKNSGTGTITLAGTSAQTFDGAASPTISTQYGILRIQSNGANWIIL